MPFDLISLFSPIFLFMLVDTEAVGSCQVHLLKSCTVLKYKFEVLILYLSLFFLCHFLLLLSLSLSASNFRGKYCTFYSTSYLTTLVNSCTQNILILNFGRLVEHSEHCEGVTLDSG